MPFGKLKIINNILLLAIGIGIGYLLNDCGARKKQTNFSDASSVWLPGNAAGSAVISISSGLAPAKAAQEEIGDYVENTEQEESGEEQKTESVPNDSAGASETKPDHAETAGRFLENPSSFKGLELELELLMLVAKRIGKGWRMNFSAAGEGKQTHYLYLEDFAGVSGDNPDFKVGSYYLVKFKCGEGLFNSGNSAISIKATDRKASWATGISAIE